MVSSSNFPILFQLGLTKNLNDLDDLREWIYSNQLSGFVVRLRVLLVVPQLEFMTAKL